MNYQEIHKSIFNNDQQSSNDHGEKPRQKYRKKDQDFTSMRYQCFCSQQYFSYCSFYQHLKKSHQGFLQSNKHFSHNNIIETFDPQHGFKIKKLNSQKVTDKAREAAKLQKVLIDNRKNITNYKAISQKMKSKKQQSQVNQISFKNKFKQFVSNKKGQQKPLDYQTVESIYDNQSEQRMPNKVVGLFDMKQLNSMKGGDEVSKRKLFEKLTNEFIKIIRYYKQLLEIVNMKQLIQRFNLINDSKNGHQQASQQMNDI